VGFGEFKGPVSDLSFTFNKRKVSSIKDISLNRFMTYSTGQYQNISLEIGPKVGGANRVVDSNYAFVLNIDINSVPFQGVIASDDLPLLFEEIFSEMEVAKKLKSPQDLK
jgi:hypothetical protein